MRVERFRDFEFRIWDERFRGTGLRVQGFGSFGSRI